ncbi:hypothetical protein DNU06_03105 [Putridiphycobacter roseus]|uniref:Phosphatidic acid phosphatase type 2/haloperoxidase domain-containing protein n=1 Tax=Putridiphycobacter roseus TaxID=2219161 RepID=A0A2W1N4T5_9FLAO|nr:phosphatase PAP2 family protein [Putridiphycobacter roseus]PZE18834.1 hypothetical protein DNU06_03105 [Putridiphycobacter roseus]
MIKSFFNTLSFLFHPLFIPIIGLYFLFTLPSFTPGLIEKSLHHISPDIQTAIYLIITMLLIIAPGISILIMMWSKLIKTVYMESKQERTYAIATILMYTAFCYVYLRKMMIDQPNYEFLLVYIFSILCIVLACFIINFYTKISLHTAGFFGLIGTIIGYFNHQINYNLLLILLLVLIGGIVASGRLYLKAHKNAEVLSGMVVGFGIAFLCMKFEWFL